jgi:hypothetical protein
MSADSLVVNYAAHDEQTVVFVQAFKILSSASAPHQASLGIFFPGPHLVLR